MIPGHASLLYHNTPANRVISRRQGALVILSRREEEVFNLFQA